MNEIDYIPYEATHRIRPLLFVVTIVNGGPGEAVAALCRENESYFTIIQYGKGTAPRDFYFSSAAIPKKEVVLAATDIATTAYYRADDRFEEAKERWEEKLGE